MNSVREEVLFQLSRRFMKPTDHRSDVLENYVAWRSAHLAQGWSRFDDRHIEGKEVIDFGSGKGNLAFYLAQEKRPRRMVGVELHGPSVDAANARAKETELPEGTELLFVKGEHEGMPLPDKSFDTLVAFDCMEHVMQPRAVMREWYRVLRPGGRALIEWFPYLNPWGPHMEALIPVPWAHLVFGQRAMMRAAERIYDLEEFEPRMWDKAEDGSKKPNKWGQWERFSEQGYINELTFPRFKRMAREIGFTIDRFDTYGFWAKGSKAPIGQALSKLPGVGEMFTAFSIIELVR